MEKADIATAPEREIIDAFVSAFITPSRRSRWRTLLSSKNGRERLRATINHDVDFDSKYVKEIEGIDADAAIDALSSNGVGENCYAISADVELDGTRPAILDVLESVVASKLGTLLISNPAHLAYFLSEDQGRQFILHR